MPPEIETGKGMKGGRPHADLQKIFCGLLFWIRSGCQWDLVPRHFGSHTSLGKYLKKWVSAGFFDQLMEEALQLYDEKLGIDWSFQSIDGPLKQAPGCSKNTGKNPTDRGRTEIKHIILTDKNGMPIAVKISPANDSDMHQIEKTFESIGLPRPKPKEVEQHLCADTGFDSAANRQLVEEWGYTSHIIKRGAQVKPIRRYNAKRWVVERTHSWLNQYRGIRTRRIHRPEVYRAMTFLACACVILAKI